MVSFKERNTYLFIQNLSSYRSNYDKNNKISIQHKDIFAFEKSERKKRAMTKFNISKNTHELYMDMIQFSILKELNVKMLKTIE